MLRDKLSAFIKSREKNRRKAMGIAMIIGIIAVISILAAVIAPRLGGLGTPGIVSNIERDVGSIQEMAESWQAITPSKTYEKICFANMVRAGALEGAWAQRLKKKGVADGDIFKLPNNYTFNGVSNLAYCSKDDFEYAYSMDSYTDGYIWVKSGRIENGKFIHNKQKVSATPAKRKYDRGYAIFIELTGEEDVVKQVGSQIRDKFVAKVGAVNVYELTSMPSFDDSESINLQGVNGENFPTQPTGKYLIQF